jgi:peptidoglycan/xylan/chitin deacetylase (PgdA/CDA1 family)
MMRSSRKVVRSWSLALPVAAVVILLIAADSSAIASPRTVRCRDVAASGGVFVARQVRATALPCGSARSKLRTWARRGSASVPRRSGGWRCTRMTGAGRWKCTRHRSGASFTVSRDRVAPTISLASPTQGAQYNAGASVTASYVCKDNAGIAKCIGTVPSGSRLATSQAGAQTFTVTAVDKAGNRATRTVTYTIVAHALPAPPDATPPTITFRSPVEGGKYGIGSPVNADYSCADNVAVVSCVGSVANGAPITQTLGQHTVSVTAKDAAGNVAAKQVTYTVTDGTPPTIAVTSPVDKATFDWAQSATVNYSCADNALATCTAAVGATRVADGDKLPTSGAPGPGDRTLEITATDTSGNVTTKDVAYTVKPAGYYALTYDDGPNGVFTEPMLAALKSVNAKATFFVVGSSITDFPGLMSEIVADGMYVENHTLHHTNLGPADSTDPTVPAHGVDAQGKTEDVTAEVRDMNTLIASYTGGVAPAFLRPPYGMYDATTVALAQSFGLTLTNWTTDTNDYTGITAAAIVANALQVPLGGIILMHDSNANSVAATPTIVNRLRDEKGMLAGKLAPSTTTHFISGWEDAGGGLGFKAEAVAP